LKERGVNIFVAEDQEEYRKSPSNRGSYDEHIENKTENKDNTK